MPPADPTTRPTTTEARRGKGRIQQSPPSIFQPKRTEFTSTQSPIQISKIFSKKQSPKKMTCKRISCQNFNERKCKTSSSQPFTETSEKKASSRRRPRRSPRRSDAGRHPPRHCQLPTCCDQTMSMLLTHLFTSDF